MKQKPPEPDVVEKTCTSKVKHRNEFTARAAATKVIFQSRGRQTRMWVYPCPFCDGWYTTRRMTDYPPVEG